MERQLLGAEAMRAAALITVLLSACSGGDIEVDPFPDDAGAADDAAPHPDLARPRAPDLARPLATDLATPLPLGDLEYCVARTNEYRAQVGKPPLGRSMDLEAYAATGAMVDGTAHMPHQHFKATQGGGIAFAENEIPWWPLGQFGNVHAIIEGGLAQMWAEGPGGGHYENMTGAYSHLGCGIYAHGDEITVTQDYN